eukprot:CAMPEP_0173434246 /NCGR_PEP_ID=MMETSP1357-20121228/12343_1 /TAXON_ID=77926 /ORGANISM="Hemiselmis rufescens, Strain PCC563" /LENGTH=30 /DNA_ID= /DNA_START= /DNA_END= /DNA_ORIENTATION=
MHKRKQMRAAGGGAHGDVGDEGGIGGEAGD